jgi:hypothetical protein
MFVWLKPAAPQVSVKCSKTQLLIFILLKGVSTQLVLTTTCLGLYIGHHQVVKVKVKWSYYRPGVAQRVGRGIALLFHDRGTRRGWVVSSTPWPHFTPGKDRVPILQEAGWAPGPVWTARQSRPHRDSIPDRPARSRYSDWAIRPTIIRLYPFLL